MKANRVVFGVVGVGSIGHRHMTMIDADGEAELAAVCDIRSREEVNIPTSLPLYSTLSEMLGAHPEIDVVSICTPNGFHAQMAIEVLRANRNALVEKPLAMTTADALAIAEAEKASRGRVFCVYQNRYTPTSAWAHDMVQSGALGNLHLIVMNCLWNRDSRYYTEGSWHGTADNDGGPLFTQYSHFIDLLTWTVGPVEICSASFADYAHQDSTDSEDTGIISFKTKSGAMGTINYSTAVADSNMECSLELIGSKACIRLGGAYMNKVEICQGAITPPIEQAEPTPNDYGGYKGSAANHSQVIRNVVETLLHGAKPTADWHDGFETVRLIEEIYSHRKGDFTSRIPLKYRP